SDLHGAGIPLSYGGQCYANYPGETQADCGVPIPGVVAPRPPEGSPLDGGMFFARANAVGDPVDTQKLSAAGATESGGFRLADVVDVGFNRSRSRTFLDDKGVHAVTASAAKDIRVGTALSIASISAVAEVFHGGDLATATGKASTDIEGVTIGGVPVLIGPEGVMVQGAKLAEAKTPDADAVRKAMAAQGLSIEPLAAPSVSKDQSTGYVNATASGFKLLLRRPTGDQFSITFGDASARATAVRASAAQGDSDLLLSAGPTNPSAAASPPGREPEPTLGRAA
ncbi:MAG: hypothetical protein QOF96_562, partial [Actinomycetota bacterium]|nr:hypothetical protein [Actinomycetota bacterium]